MIKKLLILIFVICTTPLYAAQPIPKAEQPIKYIQAHDAYGNLYTIDPQDVSHIPLIETGYVIRIGYDDDNGVHHRIGVTITKIIYEDHI